MKQLFLITLIFFCHTLNAAEKIVNVYAWGGELPKKVIQQFEEETGIKVNFSTYDSNETMYAKLKASHRNVYDVILPSAYYVERMKKQAMLTALDKQKLPNLSNLDPLFQANEYDKNNQYSVPIIWGATGIFYNSQWVKTPVNAWSQLWEKRWRKHLLLLDDAREVFSMALLSLGYNPNDSNPQHIQLAFERLVQLIPNIKLFASDSIQAVIIDEDAVIGSVWNGDAFKASAENPMIRFMYPKEGFVIWVDCLAIPTNPPHLEEAYVFINFILRPDIAAQIALIEGHAITNLKGKALLPKNIRDNSMVYPSEETLKRGFFQRDVGDETILLFNQYWEELKLSL
ncbi:spermidine/putrescine-binding periplasmic protein precursor potD (SPBP) (plasmid) [Legionella adelaidensis]|uniref:Putrescine-binding periplasmic protein n=1 Tax=Legionella adelaidensis TaxID=45056 RepID=A0A0W0R4N2_9GAMM|nr:spermidine/putrescine ABC transporter substrate-binding protein [Legionella adelaidensis]KTC66005.1 spermidine/putrescine-binding periplasmic protein precursor potD (SPBP) [Legionella adelaidensis]VEH85780.1 spermidine/putrescine-binding periplasmic protein precursor potD (SPBP) [Legionella adelaidensis]